MSVLVVAASMVAGLSGCGAIIRSSIDTQPRVDIAASVIGNTDQIVKGRAVAYVLGSSSVDDQDLVNYAPIIVQGFQSDATHADYEYWSDGIGQPICNADGQSIRVDTSTPVVFGRVEHASVYGAALKQLTYVYWYPRRDVGAIESGTVDGGIFRLTLDATGNPAILEFSQTCGCYHGVFASSRTEAQAHQEFGEAQAPRKHALEATSDTNEWIVRDIVEARAGQQPVLYISAGDHFCELLRFVDRGEALHIAEQRPFSLEHYARLEAIPSDAGGTSSMFNEQRLVRGARRWKEELVFSNLKNPGWPRHLDAMLVHWDHDRWNDPTLLERNLRLPHAIAGTDAGPDNMRVGANDVGER